MKSAPTSKSSFKRLVFGERAATLIEYITGLSILLTGVILGSVLLRESASSGMTTVSAQVGGGTIGSSMPTSDSAPPDGN